MSTISAMSGTSTASAGANRFTDMSSEEFIRIIFTELQNQDPFQPNDSGALLEQLNSIRSIESDMQLSKRLEDIVFQNQLSGAGNLIGKRVAGLTEDAQRVGGTVQSVARSDDRIALVLDNGWIIPLENVEYIDQAPGAGGATTSPPTPPAPAVTPNTVISQWGQSGSGATGDLNGDGVVNAQDLSIALGR